MDLRIIPNQTHSTCPRLHEGTDSILRHFRLYPIRRCTAELDITQENQMPCRHPQLHCPPPGTAPCLLLPPDSSPLCLLSNLLLRLLIHFLLPLLPLDYKTCKSRIFTWNENHCSKDPEAHTEEVLQPRRGWPLEGPHSQHFRCEGHLVAEFAKARFGLKRLKLLSCWLLPQYHCFFLSLCLSLSLAHSLTLIM